MASEIERKFLVNKTLWDPPRKGVTFRQGYLSRDPERTVRVRIAGENAYLTIKGITESIARDEFEYSIPPEDAKTLLKLCDKPILKKTRYRVKHEGHVWEVDVFSGENIGLAIAEIELKSKTEPFDLPLWVGEEVSHDPRYFNANLVKTPFTKW